VAAAKAGDIGAAKLVLERAVPALKQTEAPVSLSLTGRTEHDVLEVQQALGEGRILPSQAKAVLESIRVADECLKLPAIEANILEMEQR
jgi:hypothetical protein